MKFHLKRNTQSASVIYDRLRKNKSLLFSSSQFLISSLTSKVSSKYPYKHPSQGVESQREPSKSFSCKIYILPMYTRLTQYQTHSYTIILTYFFGGSLHVNPLLRLTFSQCHLSNFPPPTTETSTSATSTSSQPPAPALH